MKKAWDWLTDRNWKTWAGHGLQGLLGGLGALWLGNLPFWLGLVAGAFAHREVDNAFAHGWKDAQGQGLKAQLKASWASVTKDGYFDLVAPFVGFGIPVAFRWTVAGLAIWLGASALFILGHRLFKKKWPWEGMD